MFGSMKLTYTAPNVNQLPISATAVGSSIIILGRSKRMNNIVITQGVNSNYAVLPSSGLRFDSSVEYSRSISMNGDYNNDARLDILIGIPWLSECRVYLGQSATLGKQTRSLSFVIHGTNTADDYFGWAIANAQDMNMDGFQDILISAPLQDTVYLIFGRSSFASTHYYISNLTALNGIQITHPSSTINFGIAIASLTDFNGDGFNDIAISCMDYASQSLIYILFGDSSWRSGQEIDLNTNFKGVRIVAPKNAFSGLSLAGLGDINNDGFNDLALGSIPSKSGTQSQQTYVVYGKSAARSSNPDIKLTELREGIDGFLVSGGGFMVTAPGDVNGDGIADVMISSYSEWQGKGQGYTSIHPNPSTFGSSFPSSSPSRTPSTQPTSSPSRAPASSFPTSSPTSFFTPAPSRLGISSAPVFRPTRRPVTIRPSLFPSMKPSFRPSLTPTRKPTALPSVIPTILSASVPPSVNSPTTKGSSFPSTFRPSRRIEKTARPTNVAILNDSSVRFRHCEIPGEYSGLPSNEHYFIGGGGSGTNVKSGNFTIRAGNIGIKIYSIYPIPSSQIIIIDFNIQQDLIDLIAFDTYYATIGDLTYQTNPLTFILPSNQRIILPSCITFDLTASNFVFSERQKEEENNLIGSSSNQVLLDSKTMIILSIFSIFIFFILISYAISSYSSKKKINNDDHLPEYLKNEALNHQINESLVPLPADQFDLDIQLPQELLPPIDSNQDSLRADKSDSHSSKFAHSLQISSHSTLISHNISDPSDEEEEEEGDEEEDDNDGSENHEDSSLFLDGSSYDDFESYDLSSND
jgi:hypothetical protein